MKKIYYCNAGLTEWIPYVGSYTWKELSEMPTAGYITNEAIIFVLDKMVSCSVTTEPSEDNIKLFKEIQILYRLT